MSERKVDFIEIQNYLLSPGDIFWIKNTGARILISKKGELCNFKLIEKLQKGHQEIVIDNEVDKNFLFEMRELYSAYKNEIVFKEKQRVRKSIFESLNKKFINEGASQFELDLVLWNWFSKISFEDAAKSFDKDRDFFARAMAVAGAVTVVAWLLGFYQEEYLEKIYTENFAAFQTISAGSSMIAIKELLESIRKNLIIDKEKYPMMNIPLFGNQSGNGLCEWKTGELTELENTIMELNSSISYFENEVKNVLQMICNGELALDQRIKKFIINELKLKSEAIAA